MGVGNGRSKDSLICSVTRPSGLTQSDHAPKGCIRSGDPDRSTCSYETSVFVLVFR